MSSKHEADMLIIKWIIALGLLIVLSQPALAQPKQAALQPMNSMPYMFRDDRGSMWDVQQDGSIGDGGNDLFDGGGRLTINGTPYNGAGMPQFDPGVNEVVFPAMQVNQLKVSRRVGANAKLSYVRYTEILENPTATPVKVSLVDHFNMGGGVANMQPIQDARSKTALACVLTDGRNAVGLIGAGRGSKLLPTYQPQQNSDNATCTWDLEVPAKKTVAIVHLIVRRGNAAEAAKVLDEISEKSVLKELPPDVAKLLVNFRRFEKLVGDEEILRGELFDVVELRGGDQVKGTIKQDTFKLTGDYGTIDLPAAKVISMISTGQFKPRHLLVTIDGEIFGGHLETQSLEMELTNQQTTRIPLSQIQRLGFRKRSEEPEEWKFEKPLLMLSGGDRMMIEPLTEPIEFITRGSITLKPEAIQSVRFVSEDHGVHELLLVDGSRLTGLLAGDSIKVTLANGGSRQPVSIPINQLRQLQLRAPMEDIDPDAGTLTLTNGDIVMGTLGGKIKLQTRFDTIEMNGDEIRGITHAATPLDLQLSLWDSAIIGGQVENTSVTMKLKGDTELTVPLALVESYQHPMPRPPAMVVARLTQIIHDLNADDWKARDYAEAQLTAVGPVGVGLLREMRPAQTPEGQQRIDVILKALTESKTPPAGAGNGPGMNGQMDIPARLD